MEEKKEESILYTKSKLNPSKKIFFIPLRQKFSKKTHSVSWISLPATGPPLSQPEYAKHNLKVYPGHRGKRREHSYNLIPVHKL